MNLNQNQIIAIILAVVGAMAASTSQLTDIFGPAETKMIVSLCSLLTAIGNTVMAILTSQTGTIRTVQAMPGIEKITVNSQANQTLAQLATDQTQAKIETKLGSEATVAATAKG